MIQIWSLFLKILVSQLMSLSQGDLWGDWKWVRRMARRMQGDIEIHDVSVSEEKWVEGILPSFNDLEYPFHH